MKTLKSLLLMILFIGLNTSIRAAITPQTGQNSTTEQYCVRAIYSNGTYIPVIDLPEVEIIGTGIQSLLPSTTKNGNLVAIVELPVVEIKAERLSTNSTNIPEFNTETIFDLPVIEIVGDLPLSHVVKASKNSNNYIAVVNLPEIIIPAMEYSELSLKFHTLKINFGQLDENTQLISDQQILNDLQRIYSGSNQLGFYELSMNHCIITEQRKKICELVIKASDTAVEQLKETAIRIITN